MPQTPPPTEVSALSYEQARDELVQVVARIESGEVPLEEAMALWERGEALAAHCQGKLDQAQQRLDTSSGSEADVDGAETDDSVITSDGDGEGDGDGELVDAPDDDVVEPGADDR